MLIHSYFTDGLFEYACLLIESFKYHNGEDMKFVLTTRDLNEEQIEYLNKIYKNIDVINNPLDYERVSRMTGMSKEDIIMCKNQVEKRATRSGNAEFMARMIKWKQFASIEDRYRDSIIEVMQKYKDEDFLMHLDADMYIRKPLDDLFNLIRNNDFTITFRLKEKPHRRVFGCLLGVGINDRGTTFMKAWRKRIDNVHFKKKPKGYGQTSCYLAFMDLKDSGLKWGNIPEEYIGKRNEKNAPVWSGNLGSKKNNMESGWNDFKKIKSGIKPDLYSIGE